VTDSKVNVREAAEGDLACCLATYGHLDEADLLTKIRAHEILIAQSDRVPVGLLRFDLMWSEPSRSSRSFGLQRRIGVKELGRPQASSPAPSLSRAAAQLPRGRGGNS